MEAVNFFLDFDFVVVVVVSPTIRMAYPIHFLRHHKHGNDLDWTGKKKEKDTDPTKKYPNLHWSILLKQHLHLDCNFPRGVGVGIMLPPLQITRLKMHNSP
jgi:hypothetical protein